MSSAVVAVKVLLTWDSAIGEDCKLSRVTDDVEERAATFPVLIDSGTWSSPSVSRTASRTISRHVWIRGGS